MFCDVDLELPSKEGTGRLGGRQDEYGGAVYQLATAEWRNHVAVGNCVRMLPQDSSVQTEGALLGIRLMFCIAPAALAMLNVAALFLYPLDDNAVGQIEKALAERRSVTPD